MLARFGFFFLAALALSLTGLAQSPTTNSPVREITSVKAVLNLTREAAEARPLARIKGVVTCSDARISLCFVQDQSGGVYVYNPTPYPGIGDVVEVTGRAAEGRFSPIVIADKIAVTGKAELPKPQQVWIGQVLSGRTDSQWVELEGVVVRQSKSGDNSILTIASGASRLEVQVLRSDRNGVPNLVDARIRARGVAGTVYSGNGKLYGFQLLAQSFSFITVVEPAPADPFTSPLRTSQTLLTYTPQGSSEHRVRLRGVVTFYWPGRDIYLRDEGGSICVETSQNTPLDLGDIVEVAGFRGQNPGSPWLREGVYRKIGHTNEPPARQIGAGQMPSPELECEVVSKQATILQTTEQHSDYWAIVLESGQKVFRACYAKSWKFNRDDFQPGAVVEVTGICQFTAESPSIWMRKPTDLRLISPSPVSRQHAVNTAFALLGAAGVIAAGWLFLRVRVQRQTAAIRKREVAIEERYRDLFENSNDIIYTHDLDGRVTSMNNSGQVLFGYTESELLRMNIFELVDAEDREMSMRKMQSKVEGAQRTTYELRVRTRFGQRLYLDVTSRVVYKDGILVGIQGIARDITARKKAEEALRVSERQLRASLEERERLGRDLHDGIIQSIYAAGLNLDDCSRLARTNPESVERRLRKVTTDLNRVIREVRDFIMGLQRHRLKGEEFKAALKSLTLTAGESHAARIDLNIDEQAAAELSANQATQLLQIAREALSNTLRHANAQKLIFQLRRSDTGIVFEIIDDGVGFNPENRPQKGFGIRNMAVRAQEINASFQIVSQIGEGARIVLDIRPETPEESLSENPIAHRG